MSTRTRCLFVIPLVAALLILAAAMPHGAGATETRPVKWEQLDSSLYRMRTAGGWLVKFAMKQQVVDSRYGLGGLTFVPDPEHKWKVSNMGVSMRTDLGKPVTRVAGNHATLSLAPMREVTGENVERFVRIGIRMKDWTHAESGVFRYADLERAFAVAEHLVKQKASQLDQTVESARFSHAIQSPRSGSLRVTMSRPGGTPMVELQRSEVPAADLIALRKQFDTAMKALMVAPAPIRVPR